MNGYKKIIRSQKLRFAILRALRFIPDRAMIRLQYRIKTGRRLNLVNPQRYSEKLQWYKLHYRNPVMMQCVDKYAVREYVAAKGLQEILNELYQVVDAPGELDFASLPETFVLKTTNGSGTNILCRSKAELDVERTRRKLEEYLAMAEASAGREWAYSGSSKKIIAERLLVDPSNEDGSVSDYKFLCFGGRVAYIVYDKNRFTDHKRNFYDPQWRYVKVDSDCPSFDDDVARPENLERMISVAETLSADFPAVRVDLYNIGGRIFFGEMTFYPWSGYVVFTPDDFDFELGRLFALPEKSGL